MKLAISIGHNPTHQGASNQGHTEYRECAVIAGLLARYTGGHIIGTGTLTSKVAAINAGRYDAVIGVHLNAGGGQGSETLYHPGSIAGRDLATRIENSVRMEYHSRGAKPGTWRMEGKKPLYFLARTNCPAIIWECFFIDRESHYLGNLAEYERMAQAVGRIF